MKAVILAAGKGTRMKNITKTIPKPMVEIDGKPMLEHIISQLGKAGVTEFGLVVGYKQEMVREHFGDGGMSGAKITYIVQDVQNGTGAALHLAADFAGNDAFLFTFGDVMVTAGNYRGMIEYFREHRCDALLGLNQVDDPSRGAAVYIDNDNNIVRMVEKPPPGTSTTDLINGGIMLLTSEIFEYTVKLTLSPRGEYELTDVFGMLRDDGRILKGYILSGYWKDVGTPEDLESMRRLFE